MELLIILILVGSIIGGICAGIASSKGRSAGGWFCGGFAVGFLTGILGGWIPIVIVACLSNLNEEQSHRDQQARENRRLREQLRQERLKSEAFRQHTFARLDAHDNQLGIDTRQAHTALPGEQAQQPRMIESRGDFETPVDGMHSTQEEIPEAMFDDSVSQQRAPLETPTFAATPVSAHPASTAKPLRPPAREWHYELQGQPVGPVPEPQLLAMLRAGQINGATLVWTEELGDWKAANQIGALRPYVRT